MRACPSRRSGFPSFTARRQLGSLALGVGWALLALTAVRADIQAPPRAHAKGERQIQRRGEGPATATPQEVVVNAGSEANIVLHGEGQSGRTIEFEIRTRPLHGTISGEPVRVSRNAAAVSYVPTPGDDSTDDEFTFTAHVAGGAVSAPETVRMRLLPPPPLLAVVPAELDFGAVKAGESAQAEFTLENRGGSEASGRVDPPAPFVVDGLADYHIGRGAKQTFRIVFRPNGAQVFSNDLHFRFETGAGVHLVGTGLSTLGRSLVSTSAVGAAVPTAQGDDASNGAGVATADFTASAAPPSTAGNGAFATTAAKGPSTRAAGSREPILDRGGTGTSQPSTGANADDTSVPVNDAIVTAVQVNGVGRSTVDLSWKPPTPRPASYRVEVRYIEVDDDRPRVDWRPYAQVDVNAVRDRVTARVRGLPSGGLQMLRIVSVDSAGRLAAPSPMITVMMEQPSTWWRPTVLKVLVLLLLICGGMMARRKWEERQMLAEIDESRRRANASTGIAYKT